MFDNIGIAEMAVIAVVALVVLGPEKFPGHAKIALRFLRDFRNYWDEAKRDLAEELKPVKDELRDLKKFKAEDYLDALSHDSADDLESKGPQESTETKTIEPTSSEDNQSSQVVGRSELTPWKPVEGVEPYVGGVANAAEHTPPAEHPDYVDDSSHSIPKD